MVEESTIQAVVREARQATEGSGSHLLRQAGGWSKTPTSGRAYRGLRMDHGVAKGWTACRGTQRSAYARLLDAASCLAASQGASQAVAILDRPKGGLANVVPDKSVRARLRSAAWHGLGLLWSVDPRHDEGAWELGEQFPGADFRTVLADVEDALREVASRDAWGRRVQNGARNNSRLAERLVHPVMERVLGEAWGPAPRTFESFWRRGATDGAWQRKSGDHGKIALEVKVDEDAEAPFGQIIEDLGTFDAVVQVRLLVRDDIRAKLHDVPGIADARTTLSSRLPVKTLEIRFCSTCRTLLPRGDAAATLDCGCKKQQ